MATPIGHRGDITLRALLTLAHADAVLCEDTRVSGSLLHAYGIKRPLIACHDHNEAARTPALLRRMQDGEALALVSDAGMPVVSDPGFRLARACIEARIMVTVCPGASAVLAALTLSGLPPEPFLFLGFPPSRSQARRRMLALWKDVPASLVLYESPQRLAAALQDMQEVLGDREAAVTRELTKRYEECRRARLSELAAHYAAHPPRGEITIIAAPPVPEAATEAALDGCLRAALAQGSLRDAVAAAVAATGLPRSAVYQRALALRQEERT